MAPAAQVSPSIVAYDGPMRLDGGSSRDGIALRTLAVAPHACATRQPAAGITSKRLARTTSTSRLLGDRVAPASPTVGRFIGCNKRPTTRVPLRRALPDPDRELECLAVEF